MATCLIGDHMREMADQQLNARAADWPAKGCVARADILLIIRMTVVRKKLGKAISAGSGAADVNLPTLIKILAIAQVIDALGCESL